MKYMERTKSILYVFLLLLSVSTFASEISQPTAYFYSDYLEDCGQKSSNSFDECWNIISTVISSHHVLLDSNDLQFCLDWNIQYSYGKETDDWIKEKIFNEVISYMRKEKEMQGDKPYGHEPTTALMVIRALYINYPCNTNENP